jgi:hypothetical protein
LNRTPLFDSASPSSAPVTPRHGSAPRALTPRAFALASLLLAPALLSISVAGLPSVAQAQNLTPERQGQGGALVEEAITLAERESGQGFSSARLSVVRGAGSLIPLLEEPQRGQLATRWLRLTQAGGVSREVRLNALSDFFDAATRRDGEFARSVAGSLSDNAGRAGAFLTLSERVERTDWRRANEYALLARAAARREAVPDVRARALTFVAYRMATLNPELRDEAVIEASSQARALSPGRERDYLLAEVVGAAGKFDLGTARRIANDITDPRLKSLAVARTNLSEISQTTLTAQTQDRVTQLAQAAARYDVRAIPILLQLPPQAEVLGALSNALPPVYATSRLAVPVSLLERMWTYSQTADPSVSKDQLQSRLARLMTLHDLWRGRSWGQQLAWKGGRVQAGRFLQQVSLARRSQLSGRAVALQDLAERNVSRAIAQARALPPSARAEALLLIAGQILS